MNGAALTQYRTELSEAVPDRAQPKWLQFNGSGERYSMVKHVEHLSA